MLVALSLRDELADGCLALGRTAVGDDVGRMFADAIDRGRRGCGRLVFDGDSDLVPPDGERVKFDTTA
jgi:hypothetical protein